VGLSDLEEVSSESNEVVAIARDHDALLGCGEAELCVIWKRDPRALDLVHAHDVQAQLVRRRRYRRIDVFVQQVP
jgi:hypothetical protein